MASIYNYWGSDLYYPIYDCFSSEGNSSPSTSTVSSVDIVNTFNPPTMDPKELFSAPNSSSPPPSDLDLDKFLQDLEDWQNTLVDPFQDGQFTSSETFAANSNGIFSQSTALNSYDPTSYLYTPSSSSFNSSLTQSATSSSPFYSTPHATLLPASRTSVPIPHSPSTTYKSNEPSPSSNSDHPFTCPHCGHGTRKRRDMHRHVVANHTEKANRPRFFCEESSCKGSRRGFARQDGLLRHMNEVHKRIRRDGDA